MIKVVRIIDRLNIGGPSIHVTLVSAALHEPDFQSLLVHGEVGPDEGSMEHLPAERGVRVVRIPSLGRSVSVFKDLSALWRLYHLIHRERPDVVHTHKAKAGALGRLAAWLAGVPVIVHTFHGHVLSGYFSPFKTRLVILAERMLSRLTDRILVLSEEQRRDICERYRVAPAEKVRIVPLGFELAAFSERAVSCEEARRKLGIEAGVPLVGIVGRLVPIKNHRLFLEAAQLVLREMPSAQFVVVGDGELRQALEEQARALGIREHVRFTRWLAPMEQVYPAFDVLALTSRNEGTPVTLIEAMACGVPVVATRVGGVPDLLDHGRYGTLVPPGDAAAFAAALVSTLRDAASAREKAALARGHVVTKYDIGRLVNDLEAVYRDVLAGRQRLEG